MNTGQIGDILREERKSAVISAPDRTGLHAAAHDNLGMVTAYLDDGDTFHSAGDMVNALAAYCYGLGWLHCGAACGLVSISAGMCPFIGRIGPLPPGLQGRLFEKTGRYERLFSTARSAVRPAAEEGTPLYLTAARVSAVTSLYALQGSRLFARGEPEGALACFSYGHGWLDAGVRAGLYSVHADRDLFTI